MTSQDSGVSNNGILKPKLSLRDRRYMSLTKDSEEIKEVADESSDRSGSKNAMDFRQDSSLYMDTLDENLYDRAQKEKLVRITLCTCILLNFAFSLVTMIVQSMCDHLKDENKSECSPDISMLGFKTLNQLFNTFPLCSLIG